MAATPCNTKPGKGAQSVPKQLIACVKKGAGVTLFAVPQGTANSKEATAGVQKPDEATSCHRDGKGQYLLLGVRSPGIMYGVPGILNICMTEWGRLCGILSRESPVKRADHNWAWDDGAGGWDHDSSDQKTHSTPVELLPPSRNGYPWREMFVSLESKESNARRSIPPTTHQVHRQQW